MSRGIGKTRQIVFSERDSIATKTKDAMAAARARTAAGKQRQYKIDRDKVHPRRLNPLKARPHRKPRKKRRHETTRKN